MAEDQGGQGQAGAGLPDIGQPQIAVIPQPSFAGGVLAPGFHGRWDLDKVKSSLGELHNFIVRPSGSIAVRPGFQWVDWARGDYTTGSPTYGEPGHSWTRLVPFSFSSGDSFVLEFGPNSIHALRYGSRCWNDVSGNWITTTYSGTSTHTGDPVLQDLRFAQQGDVIYITHPQRAPYKLTRVGTGTSKTDWTWTAISYTPTLSAPTALGLVQGNTTHERRREWKYVVSAFDNETGEESVASNALSLEIYLEAQKKNHRCKISWTGSAGADSYNVFRGRNGIYGFVGSTNTTSFYDDNFAPVFSITPPSTDNPFNTTDNYPACAAFFQQRLYYARTNSEPQTVFATMVGIYNQFLKSEPPNADDAFEHILAARRMDEIRAIIPLESLVVLTADSEWVMNGPQGSAITPTEIEARPISFRGCSWLEPLVIGNRILYVDRTGNAVREIVDQGGGASGVSGDNALTILCSHLLEGRKIRFWCYQQNPDSLVWAALDDGSLLSLTYLPEYDIWAWASHSIGTKLFGVPGGAEQEVPLYFESLCCITEKDPTTGVSEDWVYATVRYGVWGMDSTSINDDSNRWYIVRMRGYGQNAWSNPFLDLSYTCDLRSAHVNATEDGPQESHGTLGFQRGSIFATGSGAGAIGGIISAGDVVIWEKDGEIVRWTGTTVGIDVKAIPDRDIPPCMQYPRTGINSYQAQNVWPISSYFPIDDCWINACVDGVVERLRFQNTSTVTTSRKGIVAHFGLPYESSATTLPIAFPGGDAVGVRKRVTAITIHAISSYKFKIQDADRQTMLSDLGYDVRDPRYDANDNGWDAGYVEGQEFIERYNLAGPWTMKGAVRIRIPEKIAGFPLQIMGIAREVQIGG